MTFYENGFNIHDFCSWLKRSIMSVLLLLLFNVSCSFLPKRVIFPVFFYSFELIWISQVYSVFTTTNKIVCIDGSMKTLHIYTGFHFMPLTSCTCLIWIISPPSRWSFTLRSFPSPSTYGFLCPMAFLEPLSICDTGAGAHVPGDEGSGSRLDSTSPSHFKSISHLCMLISHYKQQEESIEKKDTYV